MYSNISTDKLLHYISGTLIFALFQILFSVPIISFIIVVAAGFGKEAIDKYRAKEDWDWYDILATSLGGIIGLLCSL